MRTWLTVLAASLAATQLLVAQAERRVALVMGNGNYTGQPLKNPVNDARAVRDVLRDVGFETMLVENARLPEIEKAVSTFIASVRPGDTALVFYSGHGVQIDGENYLIPVDFEASSATDAKYKAYSANRLLERLNEAEPAVTFLVLDACRDNPFKATRSASRGLAGIAHSSGQKAHGTFIALATAPGDVAGDNPDLPNSNFTSGLVRALGETGLDQDTIFSHVREYVYSQSEGKQRPYTDSGLVGRFYFRPGPGQVGFDAGAFATKSELLFKEARAAAQMHQWDLAEKKFNEVAQREKETEMATVAGSEIEYLKRVREGEKLAEAGKHAEAAQVFSAGWQVFPARGEYGLEAANRFILAGKLPEAASLLSQLRGVPDEQVAARASAMLRQLAVAEPEVKPIATQDVKVIAALDENALPKSRRAAAVKPLVQQAAAPKLEDVVELPQAGSETRAVATASQPPINAATGSVRSLVVRIETVRRETAPAAALPEPPASESKPAAKGPLAPATAITLTSKPEGAMLALLPDKTMACVTPCTLKLPRGRQVVAATLEGYREQQRAIEVGAKTATLDFDLQPSGGTLFISTSTPGAMIMIDGALLPLRTPARVSLPAGSYRISLLADSVSVSDLTLEIADGKLATLTL